jgi:hypothetical protein
MLCSVMVGYQCFRGPCRLYLQSEVAVMGKNNIDIGLAWRGMVGATSQQECKGSDLVASATSVRRES